MSLFEDRAADSICLFERGAPGAGASERVGGVVISCHTALVVHESGPCLRLFRVALACPAELGSKG
eukprot:8177744-Heterocapsa_arctica.AAC.1